MINMKQKFILAICLFTTGVVWAQQKPAISSSIEKVRILLGEPVTLTIAAFIPAGFKGTFPLIDSIPHFEIKEAAKVDSTVENGGVNIIKKYLITSFDSGHWVIPAFRLSASVESDTIPVDIVFSDFDEKQPYHDIKDIIGLTEPKKKFEWWWYVMGVLTLAMIIFLARRKKPTVKIIPSTVMDPFQEAMERVKKLVPAQQDPLQFHSTLSDIFRTYIFRKKNILSLQQTTTDFLVQMSAVSLSPDLFLKMSRSLQLSDAVKFAKYISTPEENKQALAELVDVITAVESAQSPETVVK